MTANIPAYLPEIIILTMTMVVLLCDLFVSRKESILYALSQLSLILAGGATYLLWHTPTLSAFSGMFVLDPMANLLKMFIYVSCLFAFIYARKYLQERHMPQGEYYTLGLFSVLGMMVMVSANNFLPLFLGLEITSLPLYAMVALRRNSSLASEAALKYFIMGSFASALILYGLSLLYGAAHTLDIPQFAANFSNTVESHSMLMGCAGVFILAGLAFKFGAVPFHEWAPDVYHGSPAIVTLFIGSAPKIATLGLVIRLFAETLSTLHTQLEPLLIAVAIGSIALGNIVAVLQTNFKRLLAYSSIAHMGYMFLGLIPGTAEGYAAASFYIITYSLMTLGGFALIALLSKSGIEAESIDDFRGLNARNPWLAFMLLLVLFSMAGVPPTVGFFAKVMVLQALINVNLIWLAAVALIFAIIGSYYYIRVVKLMYFDAPEDHSTVTLDKDTYVMFSINGLLMLGLGIFPGALMMICRSAFAV